MPPVEDHPVHASGRIGPGHRAKCHGRTGMADGYWARGGMLLGPSGTPTGVYSMVWVDHTMSTQCRQILDLPECEGCTAPKDVEYIKRMRKL